MALNLVNMNADDMYIDTDNAEASIKTVKNYLNNINDDLTKLKISYQKLATDPSTQGTVKEQAIRIVESCKKFIKNNEIVKQNLESQMNKSVREYAQVMNSFNELDAAADQLSGE